MKSWTYRVYGLTVLSTLALPAMRTVAGDSGGGLLVTQVGDEEVLDGWDSIGTETLWTSVLPDGEVFSVEGGRDGTHVFRHGRSATFRLTSDRRLLCAPSEARRSTGAAGLWQRVLLDPVLLSVSLLSGFEGLHASAVERDEGVIAFVAGREGGKSTLAGEFERRGAALVCDDVLALARDDGTLVAHPGPPHLRLRLAPNESAVPTTIGVTVASFGHDAWVAAHRFAREPGRLAAVCVLDRGAGQSPALLSAPANPLVILPHALAFDRRPERARFRFALFGDLVATVPIYRLRASLDTPVSELADAVEAGLARRALGVRRRVAV